MQRFGEWSDAQLLREQADVTRPCHCTTILATAMLWRTFSRVGNFGFSVTINKTTKRNFNILSALPAPSWTRRKHGEFGKEFALCVTDLINQNVLTSKFKFYLFSFSAKRDDAKLWDEYAEHGTGFSIGFVPKIFVGDTMTVSQRANENAHVGRVVYGDRKTLYRHNKVIERAAKVTREIAAANGHLLRREAVHVEYINAMAKEYIARQLIWRCLTAKRGPRWEHQSEVRFVFLNQSSKFEGIEETFRDDNKFPTLRPAAARLHCGDHHRLRRTKRCRSDMARFLQDYGYSGVPVIRSLKSPTTAVPAS